MAANFVTSYLFARLLAARFGLSGERDVFDIAYSVPSFVLGISGFGWLHMVVTAHFTKMQARGSDRISRDFSTLLSWMGGAAVLLVTACAACAGPLSRVLAPGLGADLQAQLRVQILLMLPLVFTLGISTYISAVLLAFRVPLSMELAQLASRVPLLGAAAFLSRWNFSLVQVASTLLGGSACCLALEWILLRRCTPVRFRLGRARELEDLGYLANQSGAFLIAAALAAASNAYMRRLATISGPGVVATITYALMLVAPLSQLMGKPMALVLGPLFIEQSARGDRRAAIRSFFGFAAATVAVSLVASTGLWYSVDWIIAALFQGGRFDGASVAATRDLFNIFVWALPPLVLNWVVLFPVLSQKDPRAGGVIYALGYLVNILASALMFSRYHTHGLAWAYVISVGIQALLGLLYALRPDQIGPMVLEAS